MPGKNKNSFSTLKQITVDHHHFTIFSLPELDRSGMINLNKLPFSIRILLENILRNEDGALITKEDVEKVLKYNPLKKSDIEIPFMPGRVILQDFTGVPAVVDLAALRDAIKDLGGNPDHINPIVSSDLVIDHSVQVDSFWHSKMLFFRKREKRI